MPERFDPREVVAGLFRDNAAPMLLIDPASGRIESANAAAEKFYGYGPGRLLRMTIQEINVLPPEEVAAERERAAAQARNFFLFKHRVADGRLREVAVHSSLVVLDKRPLLLSIVHDRTGPATAERALRLAEERWVFALDSSDSGVWDWDIESGRAFYSERWKTMLGYRPDEIGATRSEWSSRVHPDDLATFCDHVDAHFRGETARVACEHRMRHSDGSWRWILSCGRVIERSNDGSPRRMVGTHVDLTARRRLEAELAESRRQLEEMRGRLHSLERLFRTGATGERPGAFDDAAYSVPAGPVS